MKEFVETLDRLSAAVAANDGSTITVTKADACVLGLLSAKALASRYWPLSNELGDVLNQVETYLAERADVTAGEFDIPVAANKEMKLLCELRQARGINGTPSAIRAYADQRERAANRELENISTAERFNRDIFRDDSEFADWAQSRARHTLKEREEHET